MERIKNDISDEEDGVWKDQQNGDGKTLTGEDVEFVGAGVPIVEDVTQDDVAPAG